MIRKVTLFLLVLVCLAGLTITRTTVFTQTASPRLTPCDFVERFKIVNRPTQITEADMAFVEQLIYDYDKSEGISQIRGNLPITSLRQLQSLEEFDGGRYSSLNEGRAFLLRIFFAFPDDEPCYVSSVQTASYSIAAP